MRRGMGKGRGDEIVIDSCVFGLDPSWGSCGEVTRFPMILSLFRLSSAPNTFRKDTNRPDRPRGFIWCATRAVVVDHRRSALLSRCASVSSAHRVLALTSSFRTSKRLWITKERYFSIIAFHRTWPGVRISVRKRSRCWLSHCFLRFGPRTFSWRSTSAQALRNRPYFCTYWPQLLPSPATKSFHMHSRRLGVLREAL